MNTEQHTVTIPIADYHELMKSQAGQSVKFEEIKQRMIEVIEAYLGRCGHRDDHHLLSAFATELKDFK